METTCALLSCTQQNSNYGHLHTIQVKRRRHTENGWGSRYKLISIVLLWTLAYRHTRVSRLARIYIHQLCADAGCSPEELLRKITDRDGWWESVEWNHVLNTTRLLQPNYTEKINVKMKTFWTLLAGMYQPQNRTPQKLVFWAWHYKTSDVEAPAVDFWEV